MESKVVERADSRRLTTVEQTWLAVGAVVFLSLFTSVLLDLTPHAPSQYDFRALVFPADFAVVAVIGLAVHRRRLPVLAALAAVVTVTLLGAYFVHPSMRGALLLLRWGGVVAVAALAQRQVVLGCLGVWTVFESALALVQKISGGPLGLPRVIENPFSFVSFSGVVAPPGSLVHPYLLAGLALLGGTVLAAAARQRRWLLIPTAIAVAPVGFTYSRTSLIAVAIVGICLLVGRHPAALLAFAIGIGIPAALWSDGWVTRARTSVSAESTTGFGTARGALTSQSFDRIRQQPLAGVGPGQYVAALQRHNVDTAPSGGAYKPVHNLPLLAAAEGGVIAGIAMTALLVAAAVVAYKRSVMALAVFGAFIPFLLLDHFAYTFPQGNVMLGLWLAAIATTPRRAPATRRELLSTSGSLGQRTPVPTPQPDPSPSG